MPKTKNKASATPKFTCFFPDCTKPTERTTLHSHLSKVHPNTNYPPGVVPPAHITLCLGCRSLHSIATKGQGWYAHIKANKCKGKNNGDGSVFKGIYPPVKNISAQLDSLPSPLINQQLPGISPSDVTTALPNPNLSKPTSEMDSSELPSRLASYSYIPSHAFIPLTNLTLEILRPYLRTDDLSEKANIFAKWIISLSRALEIPADKIDESKFRHSSQTVDRQSASSVQNNLFRTAAIAEELTCENHQSKAMQILAPPSFVLASSENIARARTKYNSKSPEPPIPFLPDRKHYQVIHSKLLQKAARISNTGAKSNISAINGRIFNCLIKRKEVREIFCSVVADLCSGSLEGEVESILKRHRAVFVAKSNGSARLITMTEYLAKLGSTIVLLAEKSQFDKLFADRPNFALARSGRQSMINGMRAAIEVATTAKSKVVSNLENSSAVRPENEYFFVASFDVEGHFPSTKLQILNQKLSLCYDSIPLSYQWFHYLYKNGNQHQAIFYEKGHPVDSFTRNTGLLEGESFSSKLAFFNLLDAKKSLRRGVSFDYADDTSGVWRDLQSLETDFLAYEDALRNDGYVINKDVGKSWINIIEVKSASRSPLSEVSWNAIRLRCESTLGISPTRNADMQCLGAFIDNNPSLSQRIRSQADSSCNDLLSSLCNPFLNLQVANLLIRQCGPFPTLSHFLQIYDRAAVADMPESVDKVTVDFFKHRFSLNQLVDKMCDDLLTLQLKSSFESGGLAVCNLAAVQPGARLASLVASLPTIKKSCNIIDPASEIPGIFQEIEELIRTIRDQIPAGVPLPSEILRHAGIEKVISIPTNAQEAWATYADAETPIPFKLQKLYSRPAHLAQGRNIDTISCSISKTMHLHAGTGAKDKQASQLFKARMHSRDLNVSNEEFVLALKIYLGRDTTNANFCQRCRRAIQDKSFHHCQRELSSSHNDTHNSIGTIVKRLLTEMDAFSIQFNSQLKSNFHCKDKRRPDILINSLLGKGAIIGDFTVGQLSSLQYRQNSKRKCYSDIAKDLKCLHSRTLGLAISTQGVLCEDWMHLLNFVKSHFSGKRQYEVSKWISNFKHAIAVTLARGNYRELLICSKAFTGFSVCEFLPPPPIFSTFLDLYSHDSVRASLPNKSLRVSPVLNVSSTPGTPLVNIGNCCYINSTLQVCAHLQPLSDAILGSTCSCSSNSNVSEPCFLCETKALIGTIKKCSSVPLSMASYAPRFASDCIFEITKHLTNPSTDQECAIEMALVPLLESFSEKNQALIENSIGGYFSIDSKCTNCSYTSISVQEHHSFVITNIVPADSVALSFQTHFAPVQVGSNLYPCVNCNQVCHRFNQTKISSLGKLAAVMIEHFLEDGSRIPKTMDISDNFNFFINGSEYSFSLCAAMLRFGNSPKNGDKGHWVTFIKDPDSLNFFEFNDSSKRTVPYHLAKNIINHSASVAFYSIRPSIAVTPPSTPTSPNYGDPSPSHSPSSDSDTPPPSSNYSNFSFYSSMSSSSSTSSSPGSLSSMDEHHRHSQLQQSLQPVPFENISILDPGCGRDLSQDLLQEQSNLGKIRDISPSPQNEKEQGPTTNVNPTDPKLPPISFRNDTITFLNEIFNQSQINQDSHNNSLKITNLIESKSPHNSPLTLMLKKPRVDVPPASKSLASKTFSHPAASKTPALKNLPKAANTANSLALKTTASKNPTPKPLSVEETSVDKICVQDPRVQSSCVQDSRVQVSCVQDPRVQVTCVQDSRVQVSCVQVTRVQDPSDQDPCVSSVFPSPSRFPSVPSVPPAVPSCVEVPCVQDSICVDDHPALKVFVPSVLPQISNRTLSREHKRLHIDDMPNWTNPSYRRPDSGSTIGTTTRAASRKGLIHPNAATSGSSSTRGDARARSN